MAGLYVRRNLTPASAAAVTEWAKGQGFLNITPAGEMHVTIVHSKADLELTPAGGEITVAGGDRDLIVLGDKLAATLRFQSPELTARWEEAIAAGASWDFDGYMPHLTIAYSGDPASGLQDASPFTGDLVFGPEIHEPLNENWAEEAGLLASAMRLDGIAAMALDVPSFEGHPNRMPFTGVLTQLDVPSDRAPHGSQGKKVILSTVAAQKALPSLLGMAVNFTDSFDGHDVTQKIAVIMSATIEDGAIKIGGFIYAHDHPKAAARIKASKDVLGFSYELADIYATDEGGCWGITQCVFTGAAILRKDKAAYQNTSLEASADGEPTMTTEELAAAMALALKPVTDGMTAVLTAVQAQAEASATRLAEVQAAADADAKAKADKDAADKFAALETQIADLKAAAAKNDEPARKTLSPQFTAILARADLSIPTDGTKLSVGAVDAALSKSGLPALKRIEIKNQLQREGAL